MFASTGGDVDVVPLPLLCHGRGQAAGQPHGASQVDLNVLFPLIWVPYKHRLHISYPYIWTLIYDSWTVGQLWKPAFFTAIISQTAGCQYSSEMVLPLLACESVKFVKPLTAITAGHERKIKVCVASAQDELS